MGLILALYNSIHQYSHLNKEKARKKKEGEKVRGWVGVGEGREGRRWGGEGSVWWGGRRGWECKDEEG